MLGWTLLGSTLLQSELFVRCLWLQVQCLAVGGVAGGEGAGRVRCQGDSGASRTGCTASADQEED